MNQLFTLKHFEINQINDQNYFKKRLKSYLSYTGRITSINLVQPAMDEENIGNPVDTGWSWVILFGSPSLVFLQSFFKKNYYFRNDYTQRNLFHFSHLLVSRN